MNIGKELENKIHMAFKEPFVGNLVYNDDEISEMIEETSNMFSEINNKWGATIPTSDYPLVFTTIIEIVKQCDFLKESLFECIYRVLLGKDSDFDITTNKTYQQICKIIDQLAANKTIYSLSSFKKKYYATILLHSFAPISSTYSLFDMCWEIFNKDLNQEYVNNDPVLYQISSSLKNKIIGITEDEDMEIGSKTYSFRAGMKGLIQENPNNLFEYLLNLIFIGIKSCFNSEPYKKDIYVKQLIQKWWIEKEASFGKEKTKIKKHVAVISDYSLIKPRYVYNDTVSLSIPRIRLKDNIDIKPCLEIYNNDALLETISMNTYGSGIIMTTEQISLNLDKYLLQDKLEIQIIIKHNDNEIYNSKKTLYRDFILFLENKEIKSQYCIPKTYYLYTNNIELLSSLPNSICFVVNNVYEISPIENEKIQSKNQTVYFINEEANLDIHFHTVEIDKLKYIQNDKEYKVIDGDLYVDISNNANPKDYGIKYGNLILKLTDFKFKTFDNIKRYLITELTKPGETQDFTIFKFSDNHIISFISIIKFINISLCFDKEIYFSKDKGHFIFKTDNFYEEKNFSTNDKEIFLNINDGTLVIHPPILYWCIDGHTYLNDSSVTDYWYENFNNSSIVKISVGNNINYKVFLNEHELIQNNKNEFRFGQKLYELMNLYKKIDFSLYLYYKGTRYLFTWILCHDRFIDCPIVVNSAKKIISWNPQYYLGSNKKSLQMILNDYKGNLTTRDLCLDKRKHYIFNLKDNYYYLDIVSINNNLLNSQNRESLYKTKVLLGSEKAIKFHNKTINISNVKVYDSQNLIKINNLHIDKICYLGFYRNYELYSGNLFYYNALNEKVYFNKMIDDKRKTRVINPIRIQIRTPHTVYIGYGLDQTDLVEFEYDDEFTITNERKLSICKKNNESKNKPIDYYFIEVEDHV